MFCNTSWKYRQKKLPKLSETWKLLTVFEGKNLWKKSCMWSYNSVLVECQSVAFLAAMLCNIYTQNLFCKNGLPGLIIRTSIWRNNISRSRSAETLCQYSKVYVDTYAESLICKSVKYPTIVFLFLPESFSLTKTDNKRRNNRQKCHVCRLLMPRTIGFLLWSHRGWCMRLWAINLSLSGGASDRRSFKDWMVPRTNFIKILHTTSSLDWRSSNFSYHFPLKLRRCSSLSSFFYFKKAHLVSISNLRQFYWWKLFLEAFVFVIEAVNIFMKYIYIW